MEFPLVMQISQHRVHVRPGLNFWMSSKGFCGFTVQKELIISLKNDGFEIHSNEIFLSCDKSLIASCICVWKRIL